MKDKYKNRCSSNICRLFGISRQANYQYLKNQKSQLFDESLIVERVKKIRQEHPRIGTRKIYKMMNSFLEEHQIKIGRDALFNLLFYHKLLIRRRKRSIQTTFSKHWMRKWPNLVKNKEFTLPNRLWVSDITYWKMKDKFVYISLLTDAYSKKILGYHLSEKLDMQGCIQTLKMALLGNNNNIISHLDLIHHSDRGVQYCSSQYINILQKNHIQISMTQSGDPLENAIAERVNGILKEEYLAYYEPTNLLEARKILKQSVSKYNTQRPHMSLDYQTPEKAHIGDTKNIKRQWKNYYKKTVNRI